MTTVTVAIPFYNDSKYIEKAILSVINQSYKNWNLLLVDDGSGDGSLEIAKRFTSDKRISLFSDGENKGLPYRLNEISSMVTSKYYARMDADDIMDPDRLKHQITYLEHHPEVDVVGSFAFIIDENDVVFGKSLSNNIHPSTITDIIKGGAFIHPSVTGKTEWFKKHEYDIQLRRMQDLALWMSSVKESCFRIIPEYLLFYRTGDTTLAKYLMTQKYSRSFFYTYLLKNKKMVGLFLSLYVRSLIKSFVYSIAKISGGVGRVIQKRYTPLSNSESIFAKERMEMALVK